MSVLIKGIEMPASCSDCPMCYDMMECTVSALRFWRNRPERKEFDFCTERHPDCPLVFVPTHGRLIDADALKKKWDAEIVRLIENGIEYLDCHVDTLFSDFKHDVDKMPSIILAEEVEA